MREGLRSETTEAVFCLYAKKPLHTGVRTGCHYLFRLSVFATFVVYTDCESCTRAISTNPESLEAGECGLTRETCFVARCLQVVAVTGLLWISWCVLGASGFRFFFRFIFFECARPAASMRPPCLIYISTSCTDEAVCCR